MKFNSIFVMVTKLKSSNFQNFLLDIGAQDFLIVE